MPNNHPDWGKPHSVHRPATIHLWLLALPFLVTLLPFLLVVFIVTQTEGKIFERVSDPFLCLGGLILLLFITGSMWVSDYRKWSATKTAKLSIYRSGFIYKSKDRTEACRWDEIEKLKFKTIDAPTPAFRSRKAKVIRSIEKKDGTVIIPAETLKLERITKIIIEAKSEFSSTD